MNLAFSTATSDFIVAGIWRDYARQNGSILIDEAAFRALGGEWRHNDLALWLAPDASPEPVRQALVSLAQAQGLRIELSSTQQLRAASLRIFDRSFAVTYWLQAVAIGIGLFGVAASVAGQVLARRKEFGLLAHLGLQRRHVLALVAGEGAVGAAVGALGGLALGLAVSLVLVHVVNPQSFHWTMDMHLPGWRLAALCAAVVVAGTFTAAWAGRAATGRDVVGSVKEDW